MDIGFHKHFKKQFDKFPKGVQEIFYKKLDIFIANPLDPKLNNHQLSGNMKNMRSINVTGDVRAIYEQLSKNKVLFLMIAKHSALYD